MSAEGIGSMEVTPYSLRATLPNGDTVTISGGTEAERRAVLAQFGRSGLVAAPPYMRIRQEPAGPQPYAVFPTQAELRHFLEAAAADLGLDPRDAVDGPRVALAADAALRRYEAEGTAAAFHQAVQ